MAKIGRKLLWLPVLAAAPVFGQAPAPNFIIDPVGLSPASMDILFRVQGPPGSPIDFNLQGPTTITIFPSGPIFYQLEMVQMSLAGSGGFFGSAFLSAGDGIANAFPDGPLYSQGGVQVLQNNLASSFFDIYFELSLPDQGTNGQPLILMNQIPAQLFASITQWPPYGTTYNLSNGPIPLFDIVNSGSGNPPIATPYSVSGFSLTIPAAGAVPEPGTYALIGAGLIGMALVHRKRPCKKLDA